jgi:peptidoglycan LD-endopeptidase CwlK
MTSLLFLSSALLISRSTIVDSAMTREQALRGTHAPAKLLARMALVNVSYNGFDHRLHEGQIVVDQDVANEVRQIFDEIRTAGYPIAKVIPIARYGWSDTRSILDNNTSAFNYRYVIVPGQKSNKLSNHSFGKAIDLNPKINPFVSASGHSARPYNPEVTGALTRNSKATKIFQRYGWTWGGSWAGGKDYQHFSKGGG